MIKKLIHINLLLVISVLISLSSCNQKKHRLENKLAGPWVIYVDSSYIHKKGFTNFDDYFVLNEFCVGNENKVHLPGLYVKYTHKDSLLTEEQFLELTIKKNLECEKNEEGVIRVKNDADSLFIDASKHILNGMYKVDLFYTDNGYKILILSNDSTYLYCLQKIDPLLEMAS